MFAGFCASAGAAVAGSLAIGGAFVACLYVRAGYRRSGGRAPDRNDVRVIKQRFVRVGLASVISPFIAWGAASLPGGNALCASAPLSQWFGLWSPSIATAALLPLGLTVLLFSGPIVMGWLERDTRTPWREQLRSSVEGVELQVLRNLLIGPLAEEWCFRVCMCPLLFGAGFSDTANVFTSAAVFGLAHIHHRFDADVSWLAVLVQFTYTSLFGAYSSYLFLRTGLIYGPLLAHSFCNLMGLPAFGQVGSHRRAPLLKAAFLFGLCGFTALVVLDAVYRPPLFGSLFWREASG